MTTGSLVDTDYSDCHYDLSLITPVSVTRKQSSTNQAGHADKNTAN